MRRGLHQGEATSAVETIAVALWRQAALSLTPPENTDATNEGIHKDRVDNTAHAAANYNLFARRLGQGGARAGWLADWVEWAGGGGREGGRGGGKIRRWVERGDKEGGMGGFDNRRDTMFVLRVAGCRLGARIRHTKRVNEWVSRLVNSVGNLGEVDQRCRVSQYKSARGCKKNAV